MPRKAKDLTESVEKAKKAVKDTKPSTSKTKKASIKTTKSVTSKVASAKATKSKKSTTTKKANKPKQTTTSKKTSTKKTATAKKASTKKTTTAKKASTKKATTSKKTTRTRKPKKPEVIEYYDLPYRYNQTIVKILAQTPSTLFVYWDISDADRKKYIDRFGENFFNDTYPVLIVHNKTMNYSFEIEINDFANSWYFNVSDSKCDYDIELGRRAKKYQSTVVLPDNYQYITSSNTIEAPNNHILFEHFQKYIIFKNVKTNKVTRKDVSSFNFMKLIGESQSIYNIYKKMYKENVDEINNPSSGFKITS